MKAVFALLVVLSVVYADYTINLNGNVHWPHAPNTAFGMQSESSTLISAVSADITISTNSQAAITGTTGFYTVLANNPAGTTTDDVHLSFGSNLTPTLWDKTMDTAGGGWPLFQFRGGEFAGLDYYRVWTHTDNNTYEFRISGFVWEIRTVNRAYTLVAAGDLATIS